MAFTIKEETSTGTVLFSTNGTLQDGIPTIFFTNKSFEIIDRPIWVVNKSPQREGNFTHYSGSDDSEMKVELILYGTNRDTDLTTIKTIKNKILYLDASAIDSSLTGKYTLRGDMRIMYEEKKKYIKINMDWKKYNN